MSKISIAFIDVIGLTYDGNTVYQQGLGGSESAVIFMAEELANLGFDVTVYNNAASEGIFKNVKYISLNRLNEPNDYTCDIFIGSRTIVPFQPEPRFIKLQKSAKLKILWMHDTFCGGDNLVEPFVINGLIDEIFTLSDFHTTYIANCDHGGKRNYEVLKNKIWMTRNGIRRYIDYVDPQAKDPNHFVYNASVSKGMKPLIERIWARIKQAIPAAKLTIVGGYYKWEAEKEDIYEKQFKELAAKAEYAKLNINFTGIIPQHEISKIYADASFFIYPAAFPETFGISTLESLAYNTPLITCRFGALEETAIEHASYMIDYAIEPNSLFPAINSEQQENKFVDLVLQAYSNKYLLQQKQNYCNIIKDVCEWSTVALQWKQHFYKKLGLYLPVNDYRKVSVINEKVRRVFNRRTINSDEYGVFRSGIQQRIVIISACYNARDYIAKCIESVAAQNYENYLHLIIDDASTDDTAAVAAKTVQALDFPIRNNFKVIRNSNNVGAVRNQVDYIETCDDTDIVMLLDGDDWLVNNPEIFNMYNTLYQDNTHFTYGSCWSVADNIPLVAQEYPPEVRKNKTYRQHHFNWILPYTHLRTFKKHLLNNIDYSKFKDENGNWFKAGGDGSLFYALIEQADPDKVKTIQEIVYHYNDASPLNDYKVNGEEQNKNARKIVNMNNKELVNMHVREKTILIAIPTAKNIEAETFKSIYSLEVPRGYKTQFQYFYGYNVEQVRNLIADWVVKGFDYLFSVDSDIAFPPDTLKKLLAHDKDLVSGVYIQRNADAHVVELYEHTANGGTTNIPWQKIQGKGLVRIAGCGFGCVLVKKEVFAKIGYPQFKYHSALDHRNTVSEDVDFCAKAIAAGFELYTDTSIICDHIGSYTFKVKQFPPPVKNDTEEFLNDLRYRVSIPIPHQEELDRMKVAYGFVPTVVYDIGACVLHWTDVARRVWPTSNYYVFEAMQDCEPIYQKENLPYAIGVFGSEDNKEVTFYENVHAPGGNSIYMENPQFSDKAIEYYGAPEFQKSRLMQRIETVVKEKKFLLPDLIKIDVQGAELDILKGMGDVLNHAKYLILELPNVEYNIGAPEAHEVVQWLLNNGWVTKDEKFSNNGADADWLFMNTNR